MNPINSLSIILPIFNGEEFLIDSIMSIMKQKWLPEKFELIAVNDGSIDKSELIVSEMQKKFNNIKYIALDKNYGVAHARNIGINTSQYQYLSFIDQDDTWVINKLELQKEYLSSETNYLTGLQSFKLFGTHKLPIWFKEKWARKPQDGHVFGTLLIEKKEFLEVGLLNDSLRLTDDLEWFIRAKRKGKKELIIPHILLERKIHKNNHSADIKTSKDELISILKNKINLEKIR